MRKYRKRPVVIEAAQWDGSAEGATPIIDWVLGSGQTARYTCEDWKGCDEGAHHIAIDTLEGTMNVYPGWFVIRGVKGEFYGCEPSIFEMTYEEAA